MQYKGAKKLGDEMGINFRSSPNFKFMRKYLKRNGIPACSSTEEITKGDNKEKQPPLPPGTPPPDFSSHIQLKQEVRHDEDTPQEQNDPGPEYDKPKATRSDTERKKIMCKDFVRGTCNRAPCIYSHELDLTQLKGVYRFCRDFANGKCKRAVCTFVHASTFEKENFFRTGVLPPHALSHIAQQSQPVSTAPAQPCVPTYPVNSGDFANPTYSDYNNTYYYNSYAPSMPTATIVPPGAPLDTGMYNMYTPPQLPPPVWNEGNDAAIKAEADVPKNCIKCNLAKLSYIRNKKKLEGIEKFTKAMKENILALDIKKAKLMAIFRMLLASQEE